MGKKLNVKLIVADNIQLFFIIFFFQRNRFGVSCELSAGIVIESFEG